MKRSRPRVDLDDIIKLVVSMPVTTEDQDEELLLVAEADDEIFMVKRSSGAVIESRLTTEEHKQLDVAKKQGAPQRMEGVRRLLKDVESWLVGALGSGPWFCAIN